jgi:23S rRNA pseudouridine955/2504/2580 synthase
MKNIPILFENDECLVLNKPAGLATQGGERVGASLDALLAELRSPKPLLVHRLDKDTSGLILVAKTRAAAAHFSALFAGERRSSERHSSEPRSSEPRSSERHSPERRSVSKQYLAICAGCPLPAEGSIEQELEVHGAIRQARTDYAVLSSSQKFSLLELELGTGRMHQIRRHLAQIGHPILGDDKYGDFALNKQLRKDWGLRRLLLHASRLIINEADCSLDVTAPLPDYFRQFREAFPDG